MDSCGISCWHPNWLQRFKTPRWFLIIFGLLAGFQHTSFVYFVITLTTLEKRFKIPSQTTGIILSGNEISQISLSLILTYFGGQRNRPRWIASGVVLSALSCFILASLHFIHGAGDEALQYTQEYTLNYQNSSSFLSKPLRNNKLCTTTPGKNDDCVDNEEILSYKPLILIFLSQFVLGIANTLFFPLGQSYLDDNTEQSNTSLMLAYAFSMRKFGPLLGYGLAYLMLNIYIDPRLTPIITRNDPRWLGAYWIGWNIIGAILFLFAGLIGLFPKHLPKKQTIVEYEIVDMKSNQTIVNEESRDHEGNDAQLKNFIPTLMRLLRNKLAICNHISKVFFVLGANDTTLYMGRIMEVQFNRSSHGGSMLKGPVTILGTVIGYLTSGFIVKKFKPRPKYLLFWNVIVGLIVSFTQILYTQIGCEGGNQLLLNGSLIACDSNCNCDGISYSPVCDRSTGMTYFSPCHAGCKRFDEQSKVYTNCTCKTISRGSERFWKSNVTTNAVLNEIETERDIPFEADRIITPQACDRNCDVDYYIFTLVSMITSFIISTGQIGNSILDFRAVEKRDKSFSQGLSVSLVSLFAMIPGPIIFGRVIDSTCLIWNFKCGIKGNCQLFDPIKFRYYLHLASVFFTVSGVFFDLLVWYFGKNIALYGDDEPKEYEEQSQPLNE